MFYHTQFLLLRSSQNNKGTGDKKKMVNQKEIEILTGKVLRELPVKDVNSRTKKMQTICEELEIAFLGGQRKWQH